MSNWRTILRGVWDKRFLKAKGSARRVSQCGFAAWGYSEEIDLEKPSSQIGWRNPYIRVFPRTLAPYVDPKKDYESKRGTAD